MAAVIAIAAAMVMTIMMVIVSSGQIAVTAVIPIIVASYGWMGGHESGDGRDGNGRQGKRKDARLRMTRKHACILQSC